MGKNSGNPNLVCKKKESIMSEGGIEKKLEDHSLASKGLTDILFFAFNWHRHVFSLL